MFYVNPVRKEISLLGQFLLLVVQVLSIIIFTRLFKKQARRNSFLEVQMLAAVGESHGRKIEDSVDK